MGTAKKRRARSIKQNEKRRRTVEPVPAKAEPVPAAPVPVPVELRWWRKFQTKDVLSIDVEKVEIPNQKLGKPKFFLDAGEVCLLNWRKEVVYEEKIYHEPGSFRINVHAKNGFNAHSLKHGKPMEVVRNELEAHLVGKLLVGIALGGDLESLGMSSVGLETFDLQWHWYD